MDLVHKLIVEEQHNVYRHHQQNQHDRNTVHDHLQRSNQHFLEERNKQIIYYCLLLNKKLKVNLPPQGPGLQSSLTAIGAVHCLNGLPTVDSGQ